MPSASDFMTMDEFEKEEAAGNVVPAEETNASTAAARGQGPSSPFPSERTNLYFDGSMPPQFQLDSSFSRGRVHSSRVPTSSLMPFGPQSNPSTNAAIQSTATKVVQTPGVVPNAGFTAISFVGPKESIITGSPAQPPSANFTWSWASETPGFVFQSPPPGLSGYEGTALSSFLSIVGGGTMSVTQTPTTSTTFALLGINGGSAFSTPAGWTAISVAAFAFKAITGTSPVTVNTTVGSQVDAEVFMSFFNGPAPTLVQSTTSNTASGTLAFTSSNTAGNMLVVYMRCSQFTPVAGPISITMSDTNGNRYQQIVNQDFVGNTTGTKDDFVQALFICNGCVGGANTVNFAMTPAGAGNISSPTIVIAEFGPLPAGNNIPLFGPISGSLLPAINLAATGNGGIGGILNVANGGTGDANLTAHGVLIGEGTAAVAVAAVGTKGQVLTSNGAGVDPSMQGAVVQVATTSLSSAQILALQTTPITLVAAPGAQLTIVPISISIIFFGGTIAYTDAGGPVSFNIGSATQALASNSIFTTAASPNKQIQRVAGFPATDTSGNPPTDENGAMTISKATNNFAAGNGTAKIVVHYVVMPTV